MHDYSSDVMSSFIFQEGRFLLASVCLGAEIALVYDGLRILRRVICHSNFLISIEDLLYWGFVSFGMFGLLYYENSGTFRWFSVLGAAVGMMIYKALIGRFLVEYLSGILLWCKKRLKRFIAWVLVPWRKAGFLLEKEAARGAGALKSAGRLLKKRLTVHARLIRMELRTRYRKVDRERGNGQKKNRYQEEKTE